jgi:cobalt-zinc-cadmium efflux system protein
MGHGHSHTPAGKNKKRLAIVLALTTAYLVAEVVGGLLTHSLALLADAGHMLTDVAGLGLALLAIQFAERPATPERTLRLLSRRDIGSVNQCGGPYRDLAIHLL